ncbi:MAG: alpha/beta fold hydrolase [Flavobacteriales bacterium]|nr:alpha/beta fold hydrolase [Flavobacteriales bacterium]
MFIVTTVILVICFSLFLAIYSFQEKLIFFPQKLTEDHQFQFEQPFEELSIKTTDGTVLNGLLFKANTPKGLIIYLHGNAGALDTWGNVAQTYTDLGYDLFIFDYRGYGKSQGHITSQDQLFEDNRTVYNELKKRYHEKDIIVLGYSIGTGMAAKLASDNNPRLLILQAPYYSLTDLMNHMFPVIPAFILKYKLETNKYLKGCEMPVVVFHGNQDEVIYYGASLKLQEEFKAQDTLITLYGMGHNGMTDNKSYQHTLKTLLD